MSITQRVSFQLITNKKMIFAMIVTMFLSKNVKLLLTADFA